MQRNEAGSQYANGVQHAEPQATALSSLDARTPTGRGDVLTVESGREHVHPLDAGEVDRPQITEIRCLGQACSEDPLGMRIDLAEPRDPATEDRGDPEIQPQQTGAE